jgi:hypothetical protein
MQDLLRERSQEDAIRLLAIDCIVARENVLQREFDAWPFAGLAAEFEAGRIGRSRPARAAIKCRRL